MIPRIPILPLVLAVVWAGGSVAAQDRNPADAEASARSLGKPVLLLWQAGPGAAPFTEQFDRILGAWPRWADQAALVAEFTRARAWEGPLPPSYPVEDIDPGASALVLWVPGQAPRVWTEVPPVLSLSQALAAASGRRLVPPYTVAPSEFAWVGGAVHRVYDGPWWRWVDAAGESDWVEEGPVGSVLVLRQPATGRRAAFPLDGGWGFVSDDGAPWEPWNEVVTRGPVSE